MHHRLGRYKDVRICKRILTPQEIQLLSKHWAAMFNVSSGDDHRHRQLERALQTAAVVGQILAASAFGAASADHANHLFGARRTGYTRQELAPPYRLVWTHRSTHKPRQAWREPSWETQRIDFDYGYPLSAGNGLVYVASSSDHAVHALDLETGAERWRFFTGAPVRLAPHAQGDRIWFSSDDGRIYCLEGRSGRLVWTHRPAIPDERVIGNEQMISRWPARSGVLVDGDRAYTTFGMWSPEGIFVSCLDARTGAVIWQNDSAGTFYMTQPHYEAMGGVSPQGYLALSGNILVVPCGRATPAFFDATSGELLYHESEGLFPGGAWTMLHDELTFVPCAFLKKPNPVRPAAAEADIHPEASLLAINTKTRDEVFHLHGALQGVITPDGILNLIGRKEIVSVALEDVLKKAPDGYVPRRGSSEGHFVEVKPLQRWATPLRRVYELIQAGTTLIAGGRGTLTTYDANDGSRTWEADIEGDVRELLVVGGALLVSTTEGEVHCFRPGALRPSSSGRPEATRTGAAGVPRVVRPATVPIRADDDADAQELFGLAAGGVSGGYALLLGDADAGLLSSLARQSRHLWHWAATNRDVDLARGRLADAGLYGARVVIHSRARGTLPYTDYLANQVLMRVRAAGDLNDTPAGELYRVLRPCGGVAVIACREGLRPEVERWLTAGGVPDDECEQVAAGYRIVRGPLPGAGVWTHQYADAGRTGASSDQRVRLPLKVLWFGSVGPADIVSRHYRAPAPLVIDGRMFVTGRQYLHAIDAYNGRILWERKLPGVGRWPAAYRGGSAAVDSRAVYALQGNTCLRLDQRTGETLSTYKVPEGAKPPVAAAKGRSGKLDNSPIWEYLAVTENAVIGTFGRPNVRLRWWSQAEPANSLLFALDKRTGDLKWTYTPATAIDSAAIAIDEGRLFLIDGIAAFEIHTRPRAKKGQKGKRKGRLLYRSTASAEPRVLKALDLESGRELWQTREVGPGQRSLWAAGGVLLATPSVAHGDRLTFTGPGLSAFSADSGRVLWTRKAPVFDPVIIDEVAYLPQARELRTGRPIKFRDPLTGASFPFSARVAGGCGRAAGCPNLLMKRSGSLGFVDLRQRSGTYHYSNMRASCWVNMVPAAGLVLVPEGSSSCPCAYNYKASIALMPATRHNHWGLFGPVPRGRNARIRTLQLNVGAPGDKPAADGGIWHAFPRPSTTGPRGAGGMGAVRRDKPPIEMTGPADAVRRVVCNPDWTPVADTELPWVYTSGLTGPVKLKITLGAPGAAPSPYRVILHFCELEGRHARSGSFAVKLQGEVAFTDVDVRRDAGGPNRALVRDTTMDLGDTLTLEIVPAGGAPPLFTGLQVIATE